MAHLAKLTQFVTWLNRHKLVVVLSMFIVGLLSLAYALYWQSLPQGAINFLSDIPAPKSTDRILIFSPHPDDETLGAGGYIYQSVKNGANVTVALVTNGNKHGKEVKRYAEFNSVMDQLGIKSKNRMFLDYPDGGLKKEDPSDMKAKFADIIKQASPTIILGPAKEDEHPDHRVTGQLSYELASQSKVDYYGYLVHYNRFPSPQKFLPEDYLMPPIKLLAKGMWLKYLVEPTVQDIKLSALLQYKTQLANPFLRKIFYSSVRKNELFIKY